METIDQIASKQEEAEKDGGAPVVAVEGLHKSFGNQKVLNGISLAVNRGETLAVLGRSGTGKSVLLGSSSVSKSLIRDRFAFMVKTSLAWLSTRWAKSGRRWVLSFSRPRSTTL